MNDYTILQHVHQLHQNIQTGLDHNPHFGRGEYLNEDNYKTILSIILQGNIAEEFQLMYKEG